ncbi:MAG: fibronectin type III domain-containing protein, partial [Methanosarcinales archaeon]
MRMNIRVFVLVALFASVFLQAGTADAIIVKNATSIWNTTAENMPEDITVSPRIIAEYPNSVFSSDLDTPGNITAAPRIIAEYSNSIFSFDLDTPGNITAAPRIIAEHSNTISRFYLNTPGDITAAPRIIAKNTNSIRSTNFVFPVALFNDTEQPVITNVTATNITDKSATIKWTTDEIATSLVKYGKTLGIYTESKEESRVINHTIDLTGLLPDTCYYFVVNSTDRSENSAESLEYYFNTSEVPTPTPQTAVFDTEAPANPYPTISGTHNGTITPTKTIEVALLYTYPCAGTGGHSKYVKIWNNSDWNVTARWERYSGDWHNISFGDS